MEKNAEDGESKKPAQDSLKKVLCAFADRPGAVRRHRFCPKMEELDDEKALSLKRECAGQNNVGLSRHS